MRVLAVNTAAARLSLALVEDARTVFSLDIEEPRDQGNQLLRSIDEGLKDNHLRFEDIDLMVAVTGPGSFTGIRIGLAALRGFALAANVPLAGITSFSLYAAVPVKTQHRLTVIESWREELYFQLNGEEPFNVTPAECLALLQGRNINPADLSLTGDAAEKISVCVPQATVVASTPTAADVARLVLDKPDLKVEAVPFYLRPADATIAVGGRHLKEA